MNHTVFCLRHFNDIDNITPAIHFLLERREVSVTVLIYSVDYDFQGDLSLAFLKDRWGDRIRVVWIGQLAGHLSRLLAKPRALRRLSALRKAIKSFDRSLLPGLEELFRVWGIPSSVVFDQNRTGEISGLISSMRALGVLRIASLPVSPWMNFNVLRQTDFVNLQDRNFWTKHDYSGFDAIAQVDSFYSDQLEKFFGLLGHPSPFEGRNEVVGSIRYTNEWLAIRDTYVHGAKKVPRPFGPDPARPRVLIIPSHRKNNSFWDEYLRTLTFLAQFDDYRFAVKPHTRYGDGYDQVPRGIDMAADVDTSVLIDWSDIILFWSSSAALEGFQKGRTMIRLDYLNGNRTSYAALNAGYSCPSRDELFEVLVSEEEMRRAANDSIEGARKLRQHVIEGGKGPDVIERVVQFCDATHLSPR